MDDVQKIQIADMLAKTSLAEDDLLIVEDSQNTKKMTIIEFVKNIIKDNDVPTEYRIWSSLKLNNIIEEMKEELEEGIGKVEGDMGDLQGNVVTIEQLEELKKELDKQIDDKIGRDEITSELENKRDKSVKITADDLDTSSDSAKIHIANLSQEVISAIVGGSSVPTNKAPIGGWVTEDFADGSIISNKLAENFRYVAHITEGNINSLTKDGLYLLGSGVTNLPKYEEDETDIRILDVKRISDDRIIQTVYYAEDTDQKPIYRRKGTIGRLYVTDFIEIHEVTDKFKIGRDMLTEDFSNNGIVSSGSIYLVRSEGHYYAQNTVTDLPTTDDYLVDVFKYDDRYIYTAQKIGTASCDIYVSLLYFTAGLMPVNTPWYLISNSRRSSFDGSQVHLFGDGIMFGLGSDDITNNSIPALLASQYGMKITNHAIGDATMGNYDDDNLAERSIIKQIQTATLSSADYAIIFVGTNDWKIGKGTIGTSNTQMNTTTFKGAMNQCINDIAAKNPRTKIIFCTPIFRSRIEYGDNKNSDVYTVNDRYLIEYADAMIEIAQDNHIPVIDLYRMSSINRYNSSVYLKDGLYPNDEGNKLLTSKIVSGMEANF